MYIACLYCVAFASCHDLIILTQHKLIHHVQSYICTEFPPDFRPFLEELIRTQQFSEFVDSHIFEVGRDPGKTRGKGSNYDLFEFMSCAVGCIDQYSLCFICPQNILA